MRKTLHRAQTHNLIVNLDISSLEKDFHTRILQKKLRPVTGRSFTTSYKHTSHALSSLYYGSDMVSGNGGCTVQRYCDLCSSGIRLPRPYLRTACSGVIFVHPLLVPVSHHLRFALPFKWRLLSPSTHFTAENYISDFYYLSSPKLKPLQQVSPWAFPLP